MKYYKAWTVTETLISTMGNLRKVFGTQYQLRADYNQIFFWTKEFEPKLRLILFIEATISPEHAAFHLMDLQEGVSRIRVAGSFIDIADKVKPYLT